MIVNGENCIQLHTSAAHTHTYKCIVLPWKRWRVGNCNFLPKSIAWQHSHVSNTHAFAWKMLPRATANTRTTNNAHQLNICVNKYTYVHNKSKQVECEKMVLLMAAKSRKFFTIHRHFTSAVCSHFSWAVAAVGSDQTISQSWKGLKGNSL